MKCFALIGAAGYSFPKLLHKFLKSTDLKFLTLHVWLKTSDLIQAATPSTKPNAVGHDEIF